MIRPIALIALILVVLTVGCATPSVDRAPAGQQIQSQRGDPRDGDDPACAGLPAEVVIKTHERTFNHFFYFALNAHGRICAKPARPIGGFGNGWKLFLGTGLPDEDTADFAVPRRIVAIHGDADEIFAISDTGRMYYLRVLKNPVFPGNPMHWNDKIGWPLEEPFYLQSRVLGGRSLADFVAQPWRLKWGIGRRNQIVRWFEDALGRSHTGGGGLTTYYFLSQDGTEVHFSDSGLPADHSHTVCGPRRGTFEAKAFDVSASTMFVMNRRGEMFTRMVDFDTIGSDVMFFEYSHNPKVRGNDLIAIPAEDWLPHARISLQGQARLSTHITIALSGTNNAGRELRVAGTDAQGRAGYYYKPIFHQRPGSPDREEVNSWNFREKPELSELWLRDLSVFLDPADVAAADPGAATRDRKLSGRVTIARASGSLLRVNAEIPDANLYCSPVHVKFKSGTHEFSVGLTLVEEWFHLKRNDPGRDGTPYKVMGTLDLGSWARASSAEMDELGPKLAEFIRLLKPYHLRDFAFLIDTTTTYLKGRSRPTLKGLPGVTLEFADAASGFTSASAAEHYTLVQDSFTQMAVDPSLRIDPVRLPAFDDGSQLRSLVERNRQALAYMKSIYDDSRQADKKTPFYITSSGFRYANALFQLLRWHSKIRTISNNVGFLVAVNDELKTTLFFNSEVDLTTARSLIEDRIQAYGRRLADIQARGAGSASSWVYYEDATAAWRDLFAFGSAQVTRHGLARGCQVTVSDQNLEPERHLRLRQQLELRVRCGEGEHAPTALYRVLFTELTKKLAEQVTSPFRMPAEFELRSRSDNFPANIGLPEAERFAGEIVIRDGGYELKNETLDFSWRAP